MNRYATALVGGLMGLATGVLFVRPVTAFFGAVSVTWDARNCPAGIYAITALAHSLDTTQTYSVTTRDVSLPKASVVQQFPDLPSGTYRVSATAIGNNGQTFHSQEQTVGGQGAQGGQSGGSTVLGQNRTPARIPAGVARPRNAPAPPPRPPNEPRLTPPVDDAATRAAMAAFKQPVRHTTDDLTLDPLVLRLLARLEMASGPDAPDQTWRRVAAVDTDGDGTLDIITIESVTGETWVFQIVR